MEYPKCEVCGKDAVILVQDIDAEYGRHGPADAIQYSPHGEPHHFCEEHQRDSIVYDA